MGLIFKQNFHLEWDSGEGFGKRSFPILATSKQLRTMSWESGILTPASHSDSNSSHEVYGKIISLVSTLGIDSGFIPMSTMSTGTQIWVVQAKHLLVI